MNNKEGLKPIKSNDIYRSETWLCPNCNNFVGGYIITGRGDDDWSYEKNKFCRECGTKIDWSQHRK